MIKNYGIKFFLLSLIVTAALYAALRLATAAFDIDTNIDTGNVVVGWMYLINYVLIALSVVGLAISVLVALFKKVF